MRHHTAAQAVLPETAHAMHTKKGGSKAALMLESDYAVFFINAALISSKSCVK